MLTVGIILMVASVVVGIITLTSAVLMSSSRSAGRRARTAVVPSDRKQASSYHDLFEEKEQNLRHDATQQGAPHHTGEAEQPPRWVLVLTIISGAGLVLGLLFVMIPSIL